jgi:hypothetical protein
MLTNKDYNTWFKLTPEELYASDARIKNKQIVMNMGLKCSMETTVGQQPKQSFDKNKVVLKNDQNIPDKVSISVAAISTFQTASQMISKNFQGQEFGDGKRKVTVQKVDLWSKDNKLIVALNLTGSIDGTIYLSGIQIITRLQKKFISIKWTTSWIPRARL